jgi:hypothetical protein
MILAGGSTSTGRKTCHSASLSTINLTLIGLVSNPGLGGERAIIAAFGTAGRVCLSVVVLFAAPAVFMLTVTRAAHTWAGS